jgi:peptidylprolyl isomerase
MRITPELPRTMKHLFFSSILLSSCVTLAFAQTAPAASTQPATAPKPATSPKTAVPAKTTKAAPASASGPIKLPQGVPRGRGPIKTAFSLRYQDLKIGAGADAEPNKVYKVLYTGWLASDGRKFDSSDDHRQPLKDKDGKPVLGEDGKPKLGDLQPISFPQGFGRVIPGFDQGFAGMKVGGKRRLFIPWQLAYGARGRPGPDAANPGIPAKADLIFDIELVDVADLQLPPNHPTANPMHPGMTIPPGHMQLNPPPPGPTAPGAKPTPQVTPSAQPVTPPADAKPATPPPASSTTTPPPPHSK